MVGAQDTDGKDDASKERAARVIHRSFRRMLLLKYGGEMASMFIRVANVQSNSETPRFFDHCVRGFMPHVFAHLQLLLSKSGDMLKCLNAQLEVTDLSDAQAVDVIQSQHVEARCGLWPSGGRRLSELWLRLLDPSGILFADLPTTSTPRQHFTAMRRWTGSCCP